MVCDFLSPIFLLIEFVCFQIHLQRFDGTPCAASKPCKSLADSTSEPSIPAPSRYEHASSNPDETEDDCDEKDGGQEVTLAEELERVTLQMPNGDQKGSSAQHQVAPLWCERWILYIWIYVCDEYIDMSSVICFMYIQPVANADEQCRGRGVCWDARRNFRIWATTRLQKNADFGGPLQVFWAPCRTLCKHNIQAWFSLVDIFCSKCHFFFLHAVLFFCDNWVVFRDFMDCVISDIALKLGVSFFYYNHFFSCAHFLFIFSDVPPPPHSLLKTLATETAGRPLY